MVEVGGAEFCGATMIHAKRYQSNARSFERQGYPRTVIYQSTGHSLSLRQVSTRPQSVSLPPQKLVFHCEMSATSRLAFAVDISLEHLEL